MTVGRCSATLFTASRGDEFFVVDDRPMGTSYVPKTVRKQVKWTAFRALAQRGNDGYENQTLHLPF